VKATSRMENAALKPADDRGAATRIGRNFSFRFGSQVLSALINVLGMVLLGNYLHAQGYGQYAFYYALIPLIGKLGDLGVGIIVTREIARDRETGPRSLGDAIIVKMLVSGVIMLIAAGSAWMFFPPLEATLITLVAATALLELSQDVPIWVFRAYERQDVEALMLLLSQFVWLGALAAAVWLSQGLVPLLAAATAGFVIRFVVGAAMLSRMIYRPVFQFDAVRIKQLIRQGLPFGLAMFGTVLYGKIGILALRSLATDADVAFFSVAYMLSQPLGFISSALSMAAFPVFARYAKAGPHAVRPALRKTVKYQFLVTFPMTIGLFLLAERVIPLLFHGSDFVQAGMSLKIMSAGLIFIFMNLMARYVLAALDRQQVYLRAIVVGLAVNVALCLLLIPRFGFAGGCFAYLGAELAISLICQHTMSTYLGWMDVLRESVRPLIAALLMGVVVAALAAQHLVVSIGAGIASYVALVLLLRVLNQDELRIIRNVAVSFRLPRTTSLSRVRE